MGFYLPFKLFSDSACQELALLYHSVEDNNCQHYYKKLNVRPVLFEKQAALLSRLERKDLILTFDDGFSNFFDKALPVILKYRFKAILFVTVGFIEGEIGFFDEKVKIKPLSWEQVKELSDSGIEIGSHAWTHRNLLRLNIQEAHREIAESKKKIEDVIGKKVRCLSYPYGGRNAFDNNIKKIARECGYERAYTNIMGFNNKESDCYELHRIRIYGGDNLFRFRLKVDGAYNWIDCFTGYDSKEYSM